MECLSNIKSFAGEQRRYAHWSEVNQCTMHLSVYLPPNTSELNTKPVLYWLSGLTCNDENFVQKAGAQKYAAEHGLIVVCPDTSPRGDGVPDDPNGAWDFGSGAGFYVDATEAPWNQHYNMQTYVAEELPELVANHFPCNGFSSLFGHSMGGHGALCIALKHPERYQSVSAFSPICHPTQCAWGQKGFLAYLGNDKNTWKRYDSCELLNENGLHLPLLVDQGDADNFLEEQLLTPHLVHTLQSIGVEKEAYSVRMQAGYDHSYFFIATFIEEHIAFHAEHLKQNA